MSSQHLAERVSKVVEPIAASADLIVEKVDIAQRGSRLAVAVIVDLADGPGSLGSEQLGAVSQEISAAMDQANVVSGRYTLEVSTPGVSRPLRTARHFRRATGRLAAITYRDTTDAIVTVRARILDADDSVLRVRLDDQEQEIHLADIERAVVEVELRRMED